MEKKKQNLPKIEYRSEEETKKVVYEITKLHVSGNIIPQTWITSICYKTPTGMIKPDLLACYILADIRYWYTITETKDEKTNKIIERKKKFSADILQKSYDDYADITGHSKKQVKKSFDLLENLGLIHRGGRDIRVKGGTLYNVMYVEPIPKAINDITYPLDQMGTTACPNGQAGKPKSGGNQAKMGYTYTSITTENSSETSSSSPAGEERENRPSGSSPLEKSPQGDDGGGCRSLSVTEERKENPIKKSTSESISLVGLEVNIPTNLLEDTTIILSPQPAIREGEIKSLVNRFGLKMVQEALDSLDSQLANFSETKIRNLIGLLTSKIQTGKVDITVKHKQSAVKVKKRREVVPQPHKRVLNDYSKPEDQHFNWEYKCQCGAVFDAWTIECKDCDAYFSWNKIVKSDFNFQRENVCLGNVSDPVSCVSSS